MTRYLCDTGPLLCFAQFPEGPKLFKDRYADRVSLVKEVDADLAGLRNNFQPKVARAAKRAYGKAFQWIPRIVIDDFELIEEVLLVRDIIDTFRDHPKGDKRRPQEDMADAEAIVWASLHEGTVLMTNDSPARRAAKSRGVDSISVINILEAMVRDHVITSAQMHGWLGGMGPEIDAG